MKTKNLFVLSSRAAMGALVFSLTGILASCSAGDDPVAPGDSSQAITFKTNIDGALPTRASNATWGATDEVGIYMLDVSDKLSELYHKANFWYKVDGDGNSVKLIPYNQLNTLYYPADGSAVHFTAYYPYKDLSVAANGTLQNADVPGTYNVVLGTQSTSETFDLLYHKGTTAYKKGDGIVPSMQFKHMLSKVIINVKLDDPTMIGADVSAMEVNINGIPKTATFNLADGSLDGWGTKGDVTTNQIATASGYDCTYEAIIVPHSLVNESAFSNRTITFTFDDPNGANVTVTYKIPDTSAAPTTYKAFTSEKQTEYYFTLKREKVEVNAVTIKEWVAEDNNSTITEDLI